MPGDRTIQQRDQTLFLKKAWSLTGFEYAGDKASLSGGISRSLGTTHFTAPTVTKKGIGSIYVAEAPEAATGKVLLKKDIAETIRAEEWISGRWHIDARYQVRHPRSDPENWELIERWLLARFSKYETDAETTFTLEDNAEILAALSFEVAPRQVKTLHRLVEVSRSNAPDEVLCLDKVADPLSAKASRAEEGHGVIAGTGSAVAGHPFFGRSSTGGKGWTWVQFNGLYGTPNWTNGITGIAGRNEFFIAVSSGEAAHAYTLDAGQTWTEIAFPRYSSHAPKDVVMYNSGTIWICGDDGYVWFTRDAINGQVTHAGTQVRTDLYRIYALNDRTVLAVGASNGMLKFENKRWVQIYGPTAQAAVNVLCAAPVVPRLWAAGYSDGDIYWTEDGGNSWQPDVQFNAQAWGGVYDLAHDPALRILAGGDALINENVHDAPDHWEGITPNADLTQARAVLACDENWFVVAGARTGGGLVSVLSKA